jgi:hypothetical protein
VDGGVAGAAFVDGAAGGVSLLEPLHPAKTRPVNAHNNMMIDDFRFIGGQCKRLKPDAKREIF